MAHTHGHGDHVAGDGQFADRPLTTVVARDVAAVRDFFGFTTAWPRQVMTFDLGGRALQAIGSPGHHDAAITVYDPATGFLLTGDTARSVASRPGAHAFDDFIIYNRPCERAIAWQRVRGAISRARYRRQLRQRSRPGS